MGGEGFTNFGDVQFMQNANLERYLDAAKVIADHAVVGAGPLQFYSEPGKSGFEMSGIHRIKDIYTRFGFRVASGEGGFPRTAWKTTPRSFSSTGSIKQSYRVGSAHRDRGKSRRARRYYRTLRPARLGP